MNIDFNLIKQKYPKSLKLFIAFLIKNKNLKGDNNFIEICVFKMLLKNQICYCDLERFFDDNGIIIDIIYDSDENNFWYTIHRNQFNIFDSHHDIHEHYPRKEAKQQSIYKAFEILEKKLSNEKK